MSRLDTDNRAALLVALVARVFGPQGLCALAPGQVSLLQLFRPGPLTASEASHRIGAHRQFVWRAMFSLERKGLLVACSDEADARYRLTAVAQILFDPAEAEKLATMLASRRINDPRSLDEMVAALLGDLN